MHVLTITSVVPPVAFGLAAIAIATTTTATATASAASSAVVSSATLATGAASSLSVRLLNNLASDLILRLDEVFGLFELSPAELLVLDHVLDELLDALAADTSFWGGRILRLRPDLVEFVQDAIVLLLSKLARSTALGVLSLLAELLLDGWADLLNELNSSLNCIVNEEIRVEQVLENGLGSVTTEQVASKELTDELNVAEEFVLAFHHDLAVVILGVCLACFIGSQLELFEALLSENLLEAATAEVKKLLAELAELEIVWVGAFALRLKVDLDDRSTDLLTVELGVFVLVLSLAENCLYHDVEDLVINLEALGRLSVETFLTKQLAVANEHLTELADLKIDVVLCDLVENEANLLQFVFAGSSLCESGLCVNSKFVFKFLLGLVNRAPVEAASLMMIIITATVTTTTAVTLVWASSTGLEAATVLSTTAATTVVVVLVLTRGAVHTSTLFLVSEGPIFALISASNDATMHAHLDHSLRLSGHLLHLTEHFLQELDCNLARCFDTLNGLAHGFDLSLVVIV